MAMAGRRSNSTINSTSSSNSLATSSTDRSSSTVGTSNTTSAKKRRRHLGRESIASFNPWLIFSQIVALQCFHYVILGAIFQANHTLFATSVSLDRIFTAKYLDIWSGPGWVDNSAVLLSSVTGALLLALIVEKSKKCLDFSVTIFVIHAIACTCYGGIPDTWDWWIVHIMGMIIMIILGEFFCSRRELMEIPLLPY
mmetsp:Transcript_37102/g.54548  ORF Transcript_37102/g.54548 Transcript_37102/m.54548 type:complete len:197 (-) Transcript_37102:87-677(-)|eukprot:CAMPEP_0195510952 /NCGR_PEP_ID=MMETSP0794_2-20130614/3444_1 /TAXON_ID=515487 /ORGANISM="Stephanopyxis turris, Strain CCMP 815" /LENGTH=196 /DNA_ID=CAMNT_0040638475 /DNA_START=63 /DNA_END=653 /DNA_ORIENTATION=-